ncbi:hypothetical protein HYX17_03615 [Candidatus Woesearchaeota archaeon]|nr:hypothetical protein [Candidatus Woesearchaeota archaeon]
MKGKKGDAGTNIAALILLIALFIILFMLSIPTDLREDLLPGSSSGINTDESNRDKNIDSGTVLLSAAPGKVTPFEETTIIKDLVPALLYSRLEKDTLDIATSISLERNLFTEVDRTFNFDLVDTENIKNLDLFFFAVSGEGKLKIELNGELVFEDTIDSSKIPIKLTVNELKNRNKLRFISTRGFFSDDYKLNDVKLIINRRLENKLASRDFSLTENEKDGLEDVTLNYFVNCLSLDEQGSLEINLNNRLLFNDIIFCDSGINKLDISPDRVKSGLNNMEFRINRGDYQLDDIEIELNIGEKSFPKYNFELEDDDLDRIVGICDSGFDRCLRECDFDCDTDSCFDSCTDDCELDFDCEKDSDVFLRVDFKEERKETRKRAKITINEETISFDTIDPFYERDISDFLVRGNNIIKIVPQNSFEVKLMRVFLDRSNN